MPKLNVTDELVRSLIWEVAPMVEQATGWLLPLGARRARVIPQDQGYEEVVLGRLKGLGIIPEQVLPGGWIERMIELVVESNIQAAFQPGPGEILVLRENVDDSNLDGLRLVLAHELVHAAQYRVHPEIFFRIDAVLRDVFTAMISMDDLIREQDRVLKAVERIRPDLSLLESHATYVQLLWARTRYPGAKIEMHFNLASVLMRMLGKAKLAQYSERLPEIATASSTNTLEALYSRPV